MWIMELCQPIRTGELRVIPRTFLEGGIFWLRMNALRLRSPYVPSTQTTRRHTFFPSLRQADLVSIDLLTAAPHLFVDYSEDINMWQSYSRASGPRETASGHYT